MCGIVGAVAQRDVAPIAQHARGVDNVTGVLVAAETMKHDKRRALRTAWIEVVRQLQDGGQCIARRLELYFLLSQFEASGHR